MGERLDGGGPRIGEWLLIAVLVAIIVILAIRLAAYPELSGIGG